MKLIHRIILYPHIAIAVFSFITFWITSLSKKGSKRHIKFGNIFYWCMIAVGCSATVLVMIVLADPSIVHPHRNPERSREFALILGFLAIISMTTVYNGKRTIQAKNNVKILLTTLFSILNILSLISAIGILIIGAIKSSVLFVVLSLLGFTIGGPNLKYILKRKSEFDKPYIVRHLKYMIGAGIAVHTAIVAGGTAGSHFPDFIEKLGVWPWILPTLIGIVVSKIIENKLES